MIIGKRILISQWLCVGSSLTWYQFINDKPTKYCLRHARKKSCTFHDSTVIFHIIWFRVDITYLRDHTTLHDSNISFLNLDWLEECHQRIVVKPHTSCIIEAKWLLLVLYGCSYADGHSNKICIFALGHRPQTASSGQYLEVIKSWICWDWLLAQQHCQSKQRLSYHISSV